MNRFQNNFSQEQLDCLKETFDNSMDQWKKINWSDIEKHIPGM